MTVLEGKVLRKCRYPRRNHSNLLVATVELQVVGNTRHTVVEEIENKLVFELHPTRA